jgi:hypothetical protein
MPIVVPFGVTAASTAAASSKAPVAAEAASATGQTHLIGRLYVKRRGVEIRASTEPKSGADGDDRAAARP